ncbi:MAG: hypothetical protein M1833_004204 [Piccolia ochrophora]|nr:MAG: hypothetical protein M1833_004204 [Piccolia ochrophora]
MFTGKRLRKAGDLVGGAPTTGQTKAEDGIRTNSPSRYKLRLTSGRKGWKRWEKRKGRKGGGERSFIAVVNDGSTGAGFADVRYHDI